MWNHLLLLLTMVSMFSFIDTCVPRMGPSFPDGNGPAEEEISKFFRILGNKNQTVPEQKNALNEWRMRQPKEIVAALEDWFRDHNEGLEVFTRGREFLQRMLKHCQQLVDITHSETLTINEIRQSATKLQSTFNAEEIAAFRIVNNVAQKCQGQ